MSADEDVYCCSVCNRIGSAHVTDGVVRKPVGWEKDGNGEVRCPKHRTTQSTMVTLGDLLAAKRQGQCR